MIFRFLFLVALIPLLAGCSLPQEVSDFDPKAPKAHHTATGFRNLYMDDSKKAGFFDFLFNVRYKEDWPDEEELRLSTPTPQVSVNLSLLKSPPHTELLVTWLGHSTLLIQYQGLNILTDPIFSDRASPFSFAGPRRYTDVALRMEDLPPIDAVVISHDHYDHMDTATIEAIGNSAHWYVPLGNAALLNSVKVTNVTELDWWEAAELADVKFILTPTQHWSGRGLFDRYQTLWGSWTIDFKDQSQKLWFGGDTGYNDVQFKEIGDKLGPFNMSFIPIGAYEPRWFMKNAHVNPEEAVKIHQDIKSEKSIGIHWGTFVLTSEEVTRPLIDLKIAVQKYGLAADAFITLPVGGSYDGKPQTNLAKAN